jgi:hypothetical protein
MKIPFDILPFRFMTCCFEVAVKFLTQHQGEETAEHVAADGLIPLGNDRSGVEHRLDVAERLFKLLQLLVFSDVGVSSVEEKTEKRWVVVVGNGDVE